MRFDDYVNEFSKVHICTLGPEGIDELCHMTGKGLGMWNPTWKMASVNGTWREVDPTFKGFLNYIPQYLLYLPKATQRTGNEEEYTIILTLMQKYRREVRTLQETSSGMSNNYYITTMVGRCQNQLERRFTDEDDDMLSSAVKCRYLANRDVTRRCVLKPGYYLLLPLVADAKTKCDFLLRVLVNGPFELRELKDSGPVNIEIYESKTQCGNTA